VTAGELGEKERNTNGGEGGGTGGGKGGDIRGGTRGGTGEGTDRGPLFKKKEGFTVLFFLGRPRPRPFLPRLRSAVLPIKVIKLKKELIKNETRIYNNTKKMRPKYADEIKCQSNI